MTKAILILCLMTACAVEATTATTEQGLCPIVCDEWGLCLPDPVCGSTGGGGGDPTGGGSGSCPIRDPLGNCLPNPIPGSCPRVESCDPTIPTENYYCQFACSSTSARCYSYYRCGGDPSCPEAHIGYCGLF